MNDTTGQHRNRLCSANRGPGHRRIKQHGTAQHEPVIKNERRAITSGRGRIIWAKARAANRPRIEDWQTGSFYYSIKTDLPTVIKECVVHRHVRRISRALIDERITSVTTFGSAPIA